MKSKFQWRFLFINGDSHSRSRKNHVCFRKLEYAAQYDATKIAVINIKDLDGVKNAINVITPEEVKVFQCISASTKVGDRQSHCIT